MPVQSKHASALVEYADGLMQSLRENVQSALNDFDAEAIHDARVATRRLSATLDLLEPVLSAPPRKKVSRVLKRVRRRLSPLRDLDVMLDHLHEFPYPPGKKAKASVPADAAAALAPASSRPHARALAWMIDRLEARRDKARKKSADKKTVPRITDSLGRWWQLHDELTEADQAAGTLLANSIHVQLDAFAEQAAAHARQTNEASHDGSRSTSHAAPAADDPHALRKAGKSLRYTLELADEIGRRLPRGTIRAFKHLQDALGLWHDYVVLAEAMMQASIDQMLAYHDPEMQRGVLDLARSMIKRSERALSRFHRLWLRRGESLSHAIRQAFPLTQAPAADEKSDLAAEGTEVTVEIQKGESPQMEKTNEHG